MLVVANSVPVVRPVVNIAVPELKVVLTIFVIVLFVPCIELELILVVANKVPVVIPALALIVPFTSNVYTDEVVPIPTFPFV